MPSLRQLLQAKPVVLGLVLVVLLGGTWIGKRIAYHRYVTSFHYPHTVPAADTTEADADSPFHPPLYNSVRQFERNLPQHSHTRAFPDDNTRRYIWFANEPWGVGLNNQLMSYLLDAHLCYLSKFSCAFRPFTYEWPDKPYFTTSDGKLHQTTIPVNAYIGGPVAGGSYGPGVLGVPRAVSLEWFEEVCPWKDRYIINSTLINPDAFDTDAKTVMDRYVAALSVLRDKCVMIDGATPRAFDFMLTGEPKVLTIWDSLSKSPVITQFRWSALVHSAIRRNLHLLQPPSAPSTAEYVENIPYKTIKGLIALHVRRGDYESHCWGLASWGSNYQGFNMHQDLPDKYIPDKSDVNHGLNHCIPSIERIILRVNQVRDEYEQQMASHEDGATGPARRLDRIYVATNGDAKWVAELKEEFNKAGWPHVETTMDMEVNKEEQDVGQAIDMAIMHRAEVFIGNGFSSLTANVNILRLAEKYHPYSTRFW